MASSSEPARLETSTVAGVVVDPDGTPVAEEGVFLHSPSAGVRRRATTDSAGIFRLDDVPLASDWCLSMAPRRIFRPLRTEPFAVGARGVEIEVGLEPRGVTTLSGRIVDADGAPIPSLALLLRTTGLPKKSFQLTSDARGRFALDGIPEGKLAFETRSEPRLRVRGLRLEAGVPRNVTLVVDLGEHEVSGRVIDSRGRSVIGARVDLLWSHSAYGARSSARRSTTTRVHGGFSFVRVGRGVHRLRVGAPGFRGLESRCVVGNHSTDLVVELEDLEG